MENILTMKVLASGLLLITLIGCNTPSSTTRVSNNTETDTCPVKPLDILEDKQVEKISLKDSALSASGQVNTGKQTGFSFEATQGEQLSYRTEDNICVWVYTPDGTLLNSNELPISGKYTIQVSALKGSTSFTLELDLQNNDAQQAKEPTLTPVSNSQSSKTIPEDTNAQSVGNRIEPEDFIRDYISNLNKRDYNTTWASLSPSFQSISGSFAGYTDWGNSVEQVILDSTSLISQNDSQAIVDAKLRYAMKTGKINDDVSWKIHLEWNSEKSSWEIIKNSAS